jgi:CRP-like cAMP-binding protein
MARTRLEREEIFDFLRPEQVNALSESAEVVKLKAGETVYEQGEKATFFYVVNSGQVTLRLPGKGGVSILIDQLGRGSMFGSCVSFEMRSYVLTAQCTQPTELLKLKAAALKRLLDDDPRMGYAIQSRISQIYFERYIEAMKKLQAIVMNIPLGAD